MIAKFFVQNGDSKKRKVILPENLLKANERYGFRQAQELIDQKSMVGREGFEDRFDKVFLNLLAE